MAYTISRFDVINYPPEALREFRVYRIEWIDNLHFLRDISEFVLGSDSFESPYLTVAGELLREGGWDGDGTIQLLWLPSFVFPPDEGVPDIGVVIWHVKQVEDGLSWLLSPVRLPFPGL